MAQSELIEELEKGSDPCGGKWGRPLWRKGSDPVTGRQKMLLKEKLNLYKKDDLKVFADSGHAAESGCDVLPHVYL